MPGQSPAVAGSGGWRLGQMYDQPLCRHQRAGFPGNLREALGHLLVEDAGRVGNHKADDSLLLLTDPERVVRKRRYSASSGIPRRKPCSRLRSAARLTSRAMARHSARDASGHRIIFMGQRILLMPNARPEPRPEAGAQRTLEGVGSRPSLGVGSGSEADLAQPSPLRCHAPASTAPRSDVMAQEGLNHRVHLVGHLELIEWPHPRSSH